ncbi:hypothetical protein CRUP_033849 [Coryphaenoides rupestris]|nr:hypothetical protein CRUP_033849 [Coryphaenoides rupestris]
MELETNNHTSDHGDPGCLSTRSRGDDSPAAPNRNTGLRGGDRNSSSSRSSSLNRSKTRIRDAPSDGERRGSGGSFYSDDYESRSSERSISPYTRSRTPPRTNGVVPGSPVRKTVGGGGVRRGVTRPQRRHGGPAPSQPRHLQQRGGGVRGGGGGSRSQQSKESAAATAPPRDLDLVTKRMLSARLLKINELRNAQEKALHRYDDTESEIGQLLARHGNEINVLRERLRRAQEREHAQERRLRDVEERLQRSRAAEARLRRLAEERELGPRQELSVQLEQEKALGEEAQRRIKELERGMELSSSSCQRQLAAERRKAVAAQEETRALQEELARLAAKLKEKERNLDTMNIYANRMAKTPAARKDPDLGAKGKGFPTPPPPAAATAIADGNEYTNLRVTDDYLSLKDLHGDSRGRERSRERREGGEREKEEKRPPQKLFSNGPELKPKRAGDGREIEEEEEKRRKPGRAPLQEEKKKKEVEEEVGVGSRWSQQDADEERRKKDRLLAKLREIDLQTEPPPARPDYAQPHPHPHLAASGSAPPPAPPQNHHQHPSSSAGIFSFTELEESAAAAVAAAHATLGKKGVEGGLGLGVGLGAGRRGLPRHQHADSDDLTFGSYAPSMTRPPARGSTATSASSTLFPSPPPPPPPPHPRSEEEDGERERSGGSSSSEGRNSVSLMEQLFGTLAAAAAATATTTTPPGGQTFGSSANRMAAIGGTGDTRSRREKLWGSAGSTSPPPAARSAVRVAQSSRPTVRAIASFDDDIEELTL